MKLIFAIIHDEDVRKVVDALNAAEYSVTKLCSTGGFLRVGNTTLLIGIDDDKIEIVLNIIKENSKCRKQIVQPLSPGGFSGGMSLGGGFEVTVGGATVFILEVERMEKF